MNEPTFATIAAGVAELVERKQAAYGDAFGRSGAVMRALYPDGVSPEQLDDALTIVRVVDKLFRIATSRDALGESPWLDIVGYGLLAERRAQIAKASPALPSRDAVETIVREVLASGAYPFAAATRRAGHYYSEAQRWQRKYEALVAASRGVGADS